MAAVHKNPVNNRSIIILLSLILMLGDGHYNISMDFSQINALLFTPLVAKASCQPGGTACTCTVGRFSIMASYNNIHQ